LTDAEDQNLELVAELHRRQGEMYAGGPIEPVLELLSADVVWHVPGASPIAGDHTGREGVARYFERRRELVDSTMLMSPGRVICSGDSVAQFVEGEATAGGEQVTWRTVGAYRIGDGLVREVWLVPLDMALFERIWGRSANP
jgi:ketosteroid isomerase-like protein